MNLGFLCFDCLYAALPLRRKQDLSRSAGFLTAPLQRRTWILRMAAFEMTKQHVMHSFCIILPRRKALQRNATK